MAENALQTLLETTGPKEMIMNLITTSSRSELALFYHQVLSSPPKSTLLRAIKNKQLKLFPGLTYDLIKNHLPESCPATEKGHMVQRRAEAQSRRNNRQEIIDTRKEVDDMNPP